MPRSRVRKARSNGCARATPMAAFASCTCRKSGTTSRTCTRAAAQLRRGATDVVFLGTGGSSLGGQTLAQLAGHAVAGIAFFRAAPRVHFMDNLDPETFGALLDKLPLATTRFVAVSKSGGTGETLMQTDRGADRASRRRDSARSCRHLSRPHRAAKRGKRNGLRDLLAAHSIPMLDHDPGVGGRYSALTNVGLLPAAVLGLDIGRDPRRRGGVARAGARNARPRARCPPRSARRSRSRLPTRANRSGD